MKEQPPPSDFTPEEQMVDAEFASTHRRTATGRYVVRIPVDPRQLERLGESRQLALTRFKGMERRFACDADIRERYVQFMREYEADGHMQVADDSRLGIAALLHSPPCHHTAEKVPSRV